MRGLMVPHLFGRLERESCKWASPWIYTSYLSKIEGCASYVDLNYWMS